MSKNNKTSTIILSSLAIIFAIGGITAVTKNLNPTNKKNPIEENLNNVSFVTTTNKKTAVNYVAEGIQVSSPEGWHVTSFGEFDITKGIDIKYIVPEVASNGEPVTAGSYLELTLNNVDKPYYRLMYRVWIDYTGVDRPTNVYLWNSSESVLKEISDTGWISRNVDGVVNKYHMGYSLEKNLYGERTTGLITVDNASDDVTTFFENAPSNYFTLGVAHSSSENQFGNFEYIVTEINGESFANKEGV